MNRTEAYLDEKKTKELKKEIVSKLDYLAKTFRIVKKLLFRSAKNREKAVETVKELDKPQKKIFFFSSGSKKEELKKRAEELEKKIGSDYNKIAAILSESEAIPFNPGILYKKYTTSSKSVLAKEIFRKMFDKIWQTNGIYLKIKSELKESRRAINWYNTPQFIFESRQKETLELIEQILKLIEEAKEEASGAIEKHLEFIKELKNIDADSDEIKEAVNFLIKNNGEEQNKLQRAISFITRAEKIKTKLNFHQLVAVHITKFFPKNGIIKPTSEFTKEIIKEHPGLSKLKYMPRETIHFCLNGVVKLELYGNFIGRPYAVIIPLHLIRKRVVNIFTVDTFVLGELKLPKGSTIFVFEGKENEKEKINEQYRKKSGDAEVIVCPESELKNQTEIVSAFLKKSGYTVFNPGNRSWNSFRYPEQKAEFEAFAEEADQKMKHGFTLGSAYDYFATNKENFEAVNSAEHDYTVFTQIEEFFMPSIMHPPLVQLLDKGRVSAEGAKKCISTLEDTQKLLDKIYWIRSKKSTREERKALMRLKNALRDLHKLLENYQKTVEIAA